LSIIQLFLKNLIVYPGDGVTTQ